MGIEFLCSIFRVHRSTQRKFSQQRKADTALNFTSQKEPRSKESLTPLRYPSPSNQPALKMFGVVIESQPNRRTAKEEKNSI
jgi:hypothetical protein